jgi:hypothetical protein
MLGFPYGAQNYSYVSMNYHQVRPIFYSGRQGKGRKQRLRFTKTGEVAYATHFIWPGKSPLHPPTAFDCHA